MTKPVGVFAERRLFLHLANETKELLVQLGPVAFEPEYDATSCRYQIHGFDEPIAFQILGIDDIQAIELAMYMVGSHLEIQRGHGKYSLHGEANEVEGDADGEYGHGFPVRKIPDPPTDADTPYTPPTPDSP